MMKSNAHIGDVARRKFNVARKLFMGVLLGGTYLLVGCSGKDTDAFYSSSAPDVVYNEAFASLNSGNFDAAAKKFAVIEKQYAYTEWGRKSLVMGALTNYRLSKYDDAISMAGRYISLYPDSADAAYAYYIIGLASFQKIPDVTRDQRDTKRAIAVMQLLIEKYPQSKYVKDAKDKIRFGREKLAGQEMQVGRYYEQGRQYLAASRRFRTVVEEYSDTNQVEEALFRLAEVNLALGLTAEAKGMVSALGRNYPGSRWYKFARDLLQKHNISL